MKLPNGWTSAVIGELGQVKLGKMLDKAKNSGIPTKYLRNINVRWFKFDLSDLNEMPASQDEIGSLSVQRGDLFVCEGGEPGRCAVWNSNASGLIFQKALHRFRSNNSVNARFLMYSLGNDAENGLLQRGLTGTTIKHFTREVFIRYAVALPPMPEQQRIADKLDALLARVDACRTRLDRVPGLLKRFRQAILESALAGELTTDWRELHPTDAISWTSTTLGNLSEIGTGSTPLRSNSTFYSTTGIPWVTSAATSRAFVDEAAEFVSSSAIAAHRLKVFPPGTLLVAMYGEGKTRGQVSELRISATINQACAAVRVNEQVASRAFVKVALWAQYEHMRGLAEGGNQPNLNLTKVKSLPINLPSGPEQTEIVRRVDSLFALADTLEARYQSARSQVERLTPALLAKAFRGELVPQDPNDEPADVMLARLRSEAPQPASKKRGRRAASTR